MPCDPIELSTGRAVSRQKTGTASATFVTALRDTPPTGPDNDRQRGRPQAKEAQLQLELEGHRLARACLVRHPTS